MLSARSFPLGAVHRLEHPGKISLEVIEVQMGLLGEDDIDRIEDG
jgi:mannose-1-phosphate guanylyltransferase/mannose-6-phosphate isomerase